MGALAILSGSVWEGLNLSNEQMQQQKAAAEQAREAQQEAEQQAQQAEEEKQQDEAAAKKMGVSYSDYVAADNVIMQAHRACQEALKDDATWAGASSDWIPNFSWNVNHRVIVIFGNDVEMENGFGAKRNVNYTCNYDMDSQTATIVNAD